MAVPPQAEHFFIMRSSSKPLPRFQLGLPGQISSMVFKSTTLPQKGQVLSRRGLPQVGQRKSCGAISPAFTFS